MLVRVKQYLNDFETFLADVIYDRREGYGSKILGNVLQGLSYLFKGIVKFRLLLYKNRILKSRSLGCLVVVVGNLTVGGTGKTPIVEKFAKSLTERGRKVAILSRGYKSKAEPLYKRFWRWLTHNDSLPPKVVSDGRTILLNSEDAGDEPYMLAKNLPGVIVLVDKDRVNAGHYAIKHFGVDTLILDDGFQYLKLKGRLNLLLVDKTNPFGNGKLLPRGIMREPISHLKRASYVFLTKSDGTPDPAIEAKIKSYHPDVEIIECAHKPQFLVNLITQEKIPLDQLKGKRVGAFSGIASPEGFEKLLTQLGAVIVSRKRFMDHHRFTVKELTDFFDRASNIGADLIITTEKDAVRVPQFVSCTVPIYYLRLEIDIIKGGEDFEKAVSDICFPKHKMKATRPVEMLV